MRTGTARCAAAAEAPPRELLLIAPCVAGRRRRSDMGRLGAGDGRLGIGPGPWRLAGLGRNL
jgi:hypothetical protein